MKKFLLVTLLALLAFFIFLGISQAGQCIYLYTTNHGDCYYDSSDVEYSGNTVEYIEYLGSCTSSKFSVVVEIDCARRMARKDYFGEWLEWESFGPGSFYDVAMKKLCR